MARKVLVIDIGKTNAKLALVDLATLAEVAMLSRPNRPLPGPPYPHADTEGLWAFILDGLREIGAAHRIDAIVVTTHGATAVLVDAAGGLALPVLDYEFDGPETLRAEYDRVRPDFAETGSPRLPNGLNVGAQLYWQFRAFPAEAARTASILPYAQYWSFRLTGVRATEATSLGCHMDLWAPGARDFSSLVAREGWAPLLPAPRPASDLLGPLLPEVAAATGLDPATPVHCGIHDSNASLLPHLRHPAPFAVVSTGTWVISMAIGGAAGPLDPTRDTLVNVNALGDPVPSARFMGGREWEVLTRGRATEGTSTDHDTVLGRGILLLPAVEPGSGPFQGRAARWTVPEEVISDGERAVAAAFYLALMTAVCLREIGARGPVMVEGPFGRNADYLAMLAAATGRPVRVAKAGGTGTSVGAALLAAGDLAIAEPEDVPGPAPTPAHRAYAAAWEAALAPATAVG